MAATPASLGDREALPAAERLLVHEVFHSIQGEAGAVGWPTVFIRLTGCPLRCRYCDTEYAFRGGEWQGFDALVGTARSYGVRHVCVTGGEPLAQKNTPALLSRLCDEGFEVSIETGGAHDIGVVDERVSRVVDLKTPGSGEAGRNRWENLALLTARDFVKFVICDRADYEWARDVLLRERLEERCTVLFSPSYGELAAGELADWTLADRLPVRVQIQLHKALWGDVPGR